MCQCIDTGIDNEGERTDPAYIDLDADHSYTCRRLSSTPLQRQQLRSTLICQCFETVCNTYILLSKLILDLYKNLINYHIELIVCTNFPA